MLEVTVQNTSTTDDNGCTISSLHKTGITTTVYSIGAVSGLDENSLKEKLLTYGVLKNHVSPTYPVFVISETEDLESFLQSFLKNKCLRNVHWILFLSFSKNIETDIPKKLDVSCLCSITIVQKNINTPKLTYNIFGVSKDDYYCKKFNLIGKWEPDGGISPGTSIFLQKRSLMNVKRRLLTVTTFNSFPFFLLDETPNGTVIPKSGMDLQLLNVIAESLNFRYVIKLPSEREWGIKLPNGSWSGLIGMLHREEADIALNQLTVSKERREVVDFTIYYGIDREIFATRAPRTKHHSLALIEPFTWQVWLCIFLAGAVATRFLHSTSKLTYKRNTFTSLSDTIWFLYGCLVSQGKEIPFIKLCSVRMFLATWWFFAVTLYTTYGGTLKSHMTILMREQSIDTVEALKRELSLGRYACGSLKGSVLESRFLNPDDPVYGVLGEVVRKDPQNLVKDITGGLLKTLNSTFAYIDSYESIHFHAAKLGEKKFSFSKDYFRNIAFAIALQKGSPLKVSFDKVIKRISESGLRQKWIREIKEETRRKALPTKPESSVRPLQAEDLSTVFYILLIGYFLSVFLLVLELFLCKYKHMNI
ncbi:putative glutamate receptor isoform X2 [Tachypleus tridentatus]|uniref:putative glutamate receptor isoform X2 n=1 Tax=Tachypleus tridentatus TaxID=6853 RepID=UPI003FD63E17